MGSYWSYNRCEPFLWFRKFIEGTAPADCGFPTTPTSLKDVRFMLVDWIAENRKGLENDTLPEMDNVLKAHIKALTVAWQCHFLQTRVVDVIDQREAQVLKDHPDGLSEKDLEAAICTSIKENMGPIPTADQVKEAIAPTVEKFKIPDEHVAHFINCG